MNQVYHFGLEVVIMETWINIDRIGELYRDT